MVLLTSCVNLRHVGEFTESSIEGIEKFELLAPSFTQSCLDDCLQENIVSLKIHGTSCYCTADEKADSITQLIYDTTRAYFYGLGKISNNELTNYRTDELTQSLTSGNFGSLTLDETDVNAYSNISTVILRSFTDGYRRNQIKKYVSEANQPLQTLLHFLDLNLAGNLKGKLEVQKASLKNFYFDLVADENLSFYERTRFTQEYFERTAKLTAKQRELDSFSEVLHLISEGHNALYANVNQLSSDGVRAELATYGSQLRNALPSFNHPNY